MLSETRGPQKSKDQMFSHMRKLERKEEFFLKSRAHENRRENAGEEQGDPGERGTGKGGAARGNSTSGRGGVSVSQCWPWRCERVTVSPTVQVCDAPPSEPARRRKTSRVETEDGREEGEGSTGMGRHPPPEWEQVGSAGTAHG